MIGHRPVFSHRWLRRGLGLLSTLITLVAGTAHAERWQFGLIGDVPYNERERAALPAMLDAMADHGIQFILHVGDIKHSRQPCSDALFADRLALFNASRAPFVLVPGDNEWTDCDQLTAGGHDPEERLAALRRLFWQRDTALGQVVMPLTRQAGAYPEQARFRIGPVLFATFNLPGSNNNFGMTETPTAEFQRRHPAVLAWLRENFALARREKLAGIVLAFQANPGFQHFNQGYGHRGYRAFLEALREEVLTFPGQTVVVHGDTHWSRIDHPLRDAQGRVIDRFTRVETYGYPIMGWTLGSIDTDHPTLFRFSQQPWPPATGASR